MGYLLAEPAPSDVEEFNAVTVSPGLAGFFAMFILAVVVVLLVIDMTRRVRRVQAQDRVESRMAEAERAEPGNDTAEVDPGEDPAGSAETTGEDPDAESGSRRDDPPVS